MTTKVKKQPFWIERSLQGVTYWMGHRRCLYRDYPLSEGALVAEVCNLIYANLPKNLQLLCEVPYSKLTDHRPLPQKLRGKIRTDLVVAEKAERNDEEPVPKFIIEVKRASAPIAQINWDIARLIALRHLCPNIRAFVFVISEAERPHRFVNEDGHSVRGDHHLPDCQGHYRVRRTWKAAHAFTRRDSAQYACLLEVFPGQRTHKRQHRRRARTD